MLWMIVWSIFARPLPRSVGSGWKRFLLRLFGAKIASTAVVYSTARIYMPWALEMDEYATLGDDTICYNLLAPVKIGKNATVSQGAILCTASHDLESEDFHIKWRPVVICDGAWVASEAFVCMGVTVGEGAVVGARACVRENVPPWTVVIGNPAVFYKKRSLDATGKTKAEK